MEGTNNHKSKEFASNQIAQGCFFLDREGVNPYCDPTSTQLSPLPNQIRGQVVPLNGCSRLDLVNQELR
jgi:hypothetical protein